MLFSLAPTNLKKLIGVQISFSLLPTCLAMIVMTKEPF